MVIKVTESTGPSYFTSLADFLRRVGFERPSPPVAVEGTIVDKTVRAEVDTWASTLGPQDAGPVRLQKVLSNGISMAVLAFPKQELKVQQFIALYTACLVAVDDLPQASAETSPYLEFMPSSFLKSEGGIQHSILQFFAHYGLRDVHNHFLPYPANEIGLGMFSYINGSYLELREEEINAVSEGSDTIARTWPDFLRNKTGIALPFAFFLFPKDSFPDFISYIKAVDEIATFVNLANDVLSFHKEELAEERNNYIWARARVLNCTVEEALSDTVEKTLEAARRVDLLLAPHQAENEVWQLFKQGYVDFHIRHKRYKLHSLEF